jgi:hypothetical protein
VTILGMTQSVARIAFAVVVGTALLAPSLGAQVPTRRLAAPEATFPEPFTTVSGLRALRDGRVLVADARDRVLALLDFRTGAMTSVGREGAGPGEWGSPGALHAMPGDSTLMNDFANGRMLIILPDGKVGPTFRVADEQLAAAAGLAGVDAAGRLFFERTRPSSATGPGAASSGVMEVYRHDRRTGRSEMLATYATPAGEVSAARILGGGMMQTSTNLPLAPRDVITMVPQGDFVIVRASPYRVDRIGADGRVREGPVAEGARIRVTTAEREAFVRGQIRPGGFIISGPAVSSGAGGAGAQPRPATPTFSGNIDDLMSPTMTWPDYKPPFLSNAARAAPDGRVWVLRSRAHDDPVPVYDVFDAAGRIVERVALRPRSRLVGFADGVVYVVRTDEDDLQHLERYRLPR